MSKNCNILIADVEIYSRAILDGDNENDRERNVKEENVFAFTLSVQLR